MFAFMVLDIVHHIEFSVTVDFLCRAVAAIIIGLLWFDGILYRD